MNLTKLNPMYWRILKRLVSHVRVAVGTVDVDSRQLRCPNLTVEELRKLLGERHFTNSWELSYRYEGEDLNMRRPEYVHDEYNWYQLHARGFDTDGGGVEISVHVELEPTEYPAEHLSETNFSLSGGVSRLRELFDEAGVEYELVE